MKRIIENKLITYVARYIVGFILILASIPKVAEPALFAKSILAYKIVPIYLVNIFAIGIPWIELIIGIFLIFGLLLRGSALLSAVLFAAFSFLIAISLFRGLSINCGCFGSDGVPLSWSRFVEDIGLLLLSLQIFYNSRLMYSKNITCC